MLPAIVAASLIAAPTVAATRAAIAIPAGTLDRALALLAGQTGIDVGGTIAGLDRVRTPGVTGRLDAGAALRRLLADTPFAAEKVAATSFRIVPRPRPAPRPRIAPPRVAPVPEAAPAVDIVVTASKRETSLLRFAGSVGTYPLDRAGARPGSAANLGEVANALPILQSTALGAGRNKYFVRGVADSSFNGPTQGTTGLYFGDVQVGYSGPDPNLSLYDVARVEIVEGPQGTLYGAGAIGGVITLTPNAPRLDRLGGDVQAGVTTTQGGAAGYDAAATLNVPVVAGKLAARAVGYRTVDGGYVDDLERGLKNVNRTTLTGGRLALRYAPAPDWTIDSSLIRQEIRGRDSQYAERGLPGEARRSTLAQPFSDSFLLGRLVIARQWDSGLKLVSATGWVDRMRRESFDATRILPNGPPLIYTATSRNQLFNHEMRLSRSAAGGASWVAGLAVLYDRDQFDRLFGTPRNPVDINGVTNRTVSYAGFGEATVPLTHALTVTGGGRLTRARTDGDPTTTTRNTVFVHGRISFRFDPAIGASLLLTPRLAAFARYQSGFRTGGLAVARGVGRVANFDADTIEVVEAGLRLQRQGPRGLTGSVALSHAKWVDIQADLVNIRGLPYSSNIGQGTIDGLEATAGWVPRAGLQVNAALFLADSRLRHPVAALDAERGSALPDVPRLSIGGDASYEWTMAGGDRIRLWGSARYRSHSVLGTGLLLGVRQGSYVDQTIGASWSHRRILFSATLDNVVNAAGERFALGNPFLLATRAQYTPLRPRNLRLGAAYSW